MEKRNREKYNRMSDMNVQRGEHLDLSQLPGAENLGKKAAWGGRYYISVQQNGDNTVKVSVRHLNWFERFFRACFGYARDTHGPYIQQTLKDMNVCVVRSTGERTTNEEKLARLFGQVVSHPLSPSVAPSSPSTPLPLPPNPSQQPDVERPPSSPPSRAPSPPSAPPLSQEIGVERHPISVLSPTPQAAETASFVSLTAPGRSSSSVSFEGKQVPIESIRVLDQTQAKEPPIFCGCHALKNGLVALGVAHGDFDANAFVNSQVYEGIQSLIQGKLENGGDVSIAPLSEAWRDLSQRVPSPGLEAAHRVAEKSVRSLSMVTYEEGMEQFASAGVVGGDETSLPHIAGLIEVKQKLGGREPFQHAFLMGSGGHWVTLVLERNQEGRIKWYGLDSWKNERGRFQGHIRVLEGMLADPQAVATRAFENLVGEDFERKRNWFSPNGQLKDSQDETRLLEVRNKEKYVNRISCAAEFFERAGWTRESHPNAFAAVHLLAHFYQAHGVEDVRVQQALRVVG